VKGGSENETTVFGRWLGFVNDRGVAGERERGRRENVSACHRFNVT
jgi:hypothetical protein